MILGSTRNVGLTRDAPHRIPKELLFTYNRLITGLNLLDIRTGGAGGAVKRAIGKVSWER